MRFVEHRNSAGIQLAIKGNTRSTISVRYGQLIEGGIGGAQEISQIHHTARGGKRVKVRQYVTGVRIGKDLAKDSEPAILRVEVRIPGKVEKPLARRRVWIVSDFRHRDGAEGIAELAADRILVHQ